MGGGIMGTAFRWSIPVILIGCIIVLSKSLVSFGIPVGLAAALLPLLAVLLVLIVKYPFCGFITLFCANYFIIAAFRYTYTDGLSVIIDILILLMFVSLLLNAAAGTGRYNNLRINGLLVAALIWFAYCALELFNPTADLDMWVLARGVSSYLLGMVLLTMLTFKSFREVKTILYVLSVLTLIGAGKGLVQQFIGFDAAEVNYLNAGSARTHLLASGTRYFSIFPSAGIFGALMGNALVIFFIASFYVKKWERVYFLLVAAVALYGLMISGTRGAMAVPAAGLVMFAVLSKRIRVMIFPLAICLFAYVFLTQTTLGQSNQYIRRMRTMFDPNEPSLVVRKKNQKLFAEYLQDKPFGEGLGLSGVDVQDVEPRFTTSIPTDSWYVKIWVETGIVGLCLHIAILVYIIVYGAYLLLFRIRNETLRGFLVAFHCGTFGILVASYGNQVLGQFPVVLIVYMSMGLVFIGPCLDRRMTGQECPEEPKVLNT